MILDCMHCTGTGQFGLFVMQITLKSTTLRLSLLALALSPSPSPSATSGSPSWLCSFEPAIDLVQPFQLTWNISAKEETDKYIIVTTQMLLNSKCLDMLVLLNE